MFRKQSIKLVKSKIDFSDSPWGDIFEGSVILHVAVEKSKTTYLLKFFNVQADFKINKNRRRLWDEIDSKMDDVSFALGGFNSMMELNEVKLTSKDTIIEEISNYKYDGKQLIKEDCESRLISGSDELCKWLKEKHQRDDKIDEETIYFFPTYRHTLTSDAKYNLRSTLAYKDRIIWKVNSEYKFSAALYYALCNVRGSEHTPVLLLGTIAKK